MNKPYVQSNYERIENDNYQTVDRRCVQALVDCVAMSGRFRIADCCSPSGSGIVEFLKDMGYDAFGVADAFGKMRAQFVVTNPPYKRGLVDEIMWAQINKVTNYETFMFAALLRNNFDFAKGRYDMFMNPFYYGQIHMMFRPWWSEERTAQPIHNYVWHIWKTTNQPPLVMYWKEDK